ncbi:MAG TPA: response regulator transcription factor [Candidatus Yonathbacteria bacterium]|nr:response regulator transcription factor [Candidatus Yonathbacteria bacterium]
MPHVSSQKVNDKVLNKIYNILFSAITDKGVSKKQQELAFGELLTPTEKVMLGKRLAAVSMLSQGFSSYQVCKALKLSPTTVSVFQIRLSRGGFSNTSKLCDLLRKSPLQRYIENLIKPLPRYGTSPASLFKEK